MITIRSLKHKIISMGIAIFVRVAHMNRVYVMVWQEMLEKTTFHICRIVKLERYAIRMPKKHMTKGIMKEEREVHNYIGVCKKCEILVNGCQASVIV